MKKLSGVLIFAVITAAFAGCYPAGSSGLDKGTGSVRLAVVGQDGKTVQGAMVFEKDRLVVFGTTDAKGEVVLKDLPAGRHVFMAFTQNGLGGQIEIPVFGGQTADAKLMMVQTGSVTGTARLGDKTDAVGTTVFLLGTSFVAKTDHNGAYTIFFVVPGCYTIRFEHDGYMPQEFADVCIKTGKKKILTDVVLYVAGTKPCMSDADCDQGQECRDGKCELKPGLSKEVCDGKDNDGDGLTDEGIVQTYGKDQGECTTGEKVCVGGQMQVYVAAKGPGPEICGDKKDNDCDGVTDEPACAPDTCGDGKCEPPGETIDNCPNDCGCPKGQVYSRGQNKCVDCTIEGGELMAGIGGGCCTGLTAISPSEPDGNGKCLQGIDSEFCTKCGNGSCEKDKHENWCNCPADCAPGTCGDGKCDDGETTTNCAKDCKGPKLDILFVVDDSGSMTSKQVALAKAMPGFIKELRKNGDIYLHIAVTTTNMCDADIPVSVRGKFVYQPAKNFPSGAMEHRIQACKTDADCGDGWACKNNVQPANVYLCDNPDTTPTDQQFLLDVNPHAICVSRCETTADCAAEFGKDTQCVAPGGDVSMKGCMPVPDTGICPADLGSKYNILDEDVADKWFQAWKRGEWAGDPAWKGLSDAQARDAVFAQLLKCMVTVGSFQYTCVNQEMGLRASWEALGYNGANAAQAKAFLRAEASLLVVIVSDEDDCSSPQLLSANQTKNCACLTGQWGTFPNPYMGNGGKNESGPLFAIKDSVGRIMFIKDPSRKGTPDNVFFAVVTGLPEPGSGLTPSQDKKATINRYYDCKCGSGNYADINYICNGAGGPASMGGRYVQIAQGFVNNGFVENICTDTDLGTAMTDIADKTHYRMVQASTVCGNGICEPGETPQICSQDCGAPTDPGHLKWKVKIDDAILGSPAIGTDGTVYFGGRYLYAMNPDGTMKWQFRDQDKTNYSNYMPPAIGADSTLYMGSASNYEPNFSNGFLYALNPDGTVKWKYQLAGLTRSCPSIGTDKTIYVESNVENDIFGPGNTTNDCKTSFCSYLSAVNPDGTLKWLFDKAEYLSGAPVIGANKTVYITGDYLYALNPDGTVKWQFDAGQTFHENPAIGADGTLYAVAQDSSLYAINPDGSLKWKFTSTGASFAPVIGPDNTIYLARGYDRDNDTILYAINPDSSVKYSLKRPDNIDATASPVIGTDGTVYLAAGQGYLYAMKPDGTVIWRFKADNAFKISAAIGADGTLYLGNSDFYPSIYAITSASKGLAASPWPRVGHDNKNTGLYTDSTGKAPW